MLFIYLPYEEEGDEERRHGGHQSENKVLQLREPLHMAQKSKNVLDNLIIYPLTHSTPRTRPRSNRSDRGPDR